MTIDDRIIIDIDERLKGNEISAARALAPVAIMKSGSTPGFSTKGLPGYYCGDREASTVVVNLNPGMDAELSNGLWNVMTKAFDHSTTNAFISDLKEKNEKYGYYDAGRYDEFDIKQAAFLTPWENSGIDLDSSPDWKNKVTQLESKQNVLLQKLQLELIPYASAKFKIDKKKMGLFVPYLDTLLEEIFRKKRKYVIFASDIFDGLFKYYNKKTKTKTFLLHKEEKGLLKNRNGRCRVVEICYKGKKQRALIAHTFPSQSLCKAFDLMQKYGEMCYNEFCK